MDRIHIRVDHENNSGKCQWHTPQVERLSFGDTLTGIDGLDENDAGNPGPISTGPS